MSSQQESLHLTEHEYEQLRRATRTHREELVVRLCGEVGLRTSEIVRLTPDDVVGEGGQGRTRYFVTVEESDGGTRTAYMPSRTAHDFWQYVNSNEIGDDEPVFDVSERRIQMLVDEIGDRAASATGRATLQDVTPSTLRQYFARELLVTHGIDARVVAAVGGWQGVDALLSAMDDPSRTEIAAAFEHIETSTEDESSLLARIVTTLESVDGELVQAATRGEINQRVCEVLTDIYAGVWILDRDASRDRLTVDAHAGESPDRFEGPADTSLPRRALQTGQAMVAPDDPGPASDLEGQGVLGAVPISHGDTVYGVLVVRADRLDAFDKPERTALRALGRRIAFAITATERRLLLLGDTVLELTFAYTDDTDPLVSLSATLGANLELDGVVPGEESSLLCYLDARGTTTEEVFEQIDDLPDVERGRLIQRYDDGGRFEVRVHRSSPLLLLAERGATLTKFRAEAGEAVLSCEVSPETDVRTLTGTLREEFPSLSLRSKQERSVAEESRDLGHSLVDRLTDKQRSVLEGAYHAGYFEWPRGSTAEDLADSMGVSSPTLHNHLRKAQQKLLESIFEE